MTRVKDRPSLMSSSQYTSQSFGKKWDNEAWKGPNKSLIELRALGAQAGWHLALG